MNKELQEKIANAMKETFVGNYIFTAEEQAEMLEELSRSFSYACNAWGKSLSHLQYELTFVVLVNLTKQWNANEDTWLDFLYKKLLGRQSLENEPTGKAYRIIQDVYDDLVANNKIFYFESFTKKYYASITSHAMSPKDSFLSFFDMCWEIYSDPEVLNQEYLKNDSAFELIAQSLKNKLRGKLEDDVDIKFGSKVYSLRASIKGLIMDRSEIFISLIEDTVCSINSLFNNEPIKKDNYLHTLIVEWWLKKEKTFGLERRINKFNRERVITDYSQIRAKYFIDDGMVKLCVPSFALLSDFDIAPNIEIMSDEGLVLKQELEISSLLASTKRFEIAVNDLSISHLSDIRVVITRNGELIYDSKNKLNRDFILLNDKKEIVAQDCLPDNYYLYINDIGELTHYPDDIQRISINTFSINAIEGDILQGKHKTVFFITEKTERELYLFTRKRNDLLFRKNGEDYKIIDGDLFVDILSSMVAKDYGVRYGNTTFRLVDFESENIEDRVRFNISNIIDVGEAIHISIFKYVDNSIVTTLNIVKFNNIKLTFDRQYYYGENVRGCVRFKTDKYDETINFDASDHEIFIPIEDGEIFIVPPTIRWRIDNNLWRYTPHDSPVWYKKHNNSSVLQIMMPKNLNYSVGIGNHFLTTTENSSTYNMGRSLFSLKETNFIDDLPLFIKIDSELLLLENIVTKEKFVGEPITVNSREKKVYWNPEYFIGDANSNFEIRFYRDNRLLTKVTCDNSEKKIYSVSSFEDDYYEMEVVYLPNSLIKKEIVCFRKKYAFGNEKRFRFKNKMLVLKSAILLGSAKEVDIRPLYINNLNYLGEYENCDVYSGKLFLINRNTYGRNYVNVLRDENGQNIQINPLRIELRTNRTCYIGYGLLETENDFDYTDEFTLDGNDKISVSVKANGQKNRSIDYYIMEVTTNV